MTLLVTKAANGRYRWQGISSTNVRDRDDEIVSELALQADVARTKAQSDTSELWLYHVPYRLGGAPDFRAVVDGHLVESGEFDDTPHAKAIAEYIANTPDGPDGNGWGMSIGFRGAREEGRVFNNIVISERSILPLTKAANPFTAFQIGGNEMALTKQQQEFLDQLASNPEVRDAAKAIIGAAEQSKALNTAGVERKSVSDVPALADDIARAVASQLTAAFAAAQGKGPVVAEVAKAETPVEVVKEITSTEGAQYAHGPGGIASDPGVTPAKKKAKPVDDAEEGDDEEAETEADDEEAEGEAPAKKKSLDGLTVDDLADAIDAHVKAAMTPYLEQIAGLLKDQAELLAQQQDALAVEKAHNETLQARYVSPRVALQEQLASRAKATAIEKDDPLVKAADSAVETDVNLFAGLGFGKGNT